VRLPFGIWISRSRCPSAQVHARDRAWIDSATNRSPASAAAAP
jgi:hypothetical protein